MANDQPGTTGPSTPLPFVAATFQLPLGTSQIACSVPVPAGPIGMTQLIPSLHHLSNTLTAAATDLTASQAAPVSCRKGCSACCRQLIPLTLYEAEALADAIHSLPPQSQALLEARFEEALRQLSPSGLLPRLDPERLPPPHSPEREQLALDYLAQRVDCPFLEDDACTIHPIRPLVCREYLVTSPAAHCVAPTPETVARVPLPVSLSQHLANYARRQTALPAGWFPLIHLFAWMRRRTAPIADTLTPGPLLLEALLLDRSPAISPPSPL